ncbi:hypothetical protein [Desulfovibrio aminophilus]|uniref:hypothetical protein n=1 Tax=Desulfovibrio aminophilus TaxID=81425 RepID=UPI0004083130|nr:hypothetical protein [Desulfovibrio aminophilus]
MTYRDIFIGILMEATGLPRGEIESVVLEAERNPLVKQRHEEEIPDDRAERIMTDLRSDLGGVRRWLLEGWNRAHRTSSPREQ